MGIKGFRGELELAPIGNGIEMRVLKSFEYEDASSHILTAKPGFITDGASIPRALWTFVGAPFNGLYLPAAVIHDVGCVERSYTSDETHRMFYDAMLDCGVSDSQALLIYYGVRIGGPKWGITITGRSTIMFCVDERFPRSRPVVSTEVPTPTECLWERMLITEELPQNTQERLLDHYSKSLEMRKEVGLLPTPGEVERVSEDHSVLNALKDSGLPYCEYGSR